MKRILFVDDEPRILDGLRRMLRGNRREWEMVFALGGEAALAELQDATFDVVVTDMRMPGIDGVELLLKASRIRPSAVRVVLSGQTERASAVRAAAVAHQFIVKPSSSEAVRMVIERVCQIREVLPDEELRAAVGCIRTVPVLAANYDALSEALDRSDPSPDEIGRIVRADPGLAAKLLQLVNSAFFGAPREVGEVTTAVQLLGSATLRELVQSGEVWMPVAELEHDHLHPANGRSHAAAEAADSDRSNDQIAYTVGLLQDLGPLLIAAPGWIGMHPQDSVTAAELPARIGAYLLGLWNLPAFLLDGITEPVTSAPLLPGDSTPPAESTPRFAGLALAPGISI